MPALAGLRRFASSRNGKLALGGTAATGVVAAGLYTRSRNAGDPAAPPPLIPYSEVQGTSGANAGAFPSLEATGVNVGELEAVYNQLGSVADRVDVLWAAKQAAAPPTPPPAPAPKPASGGTELHRIGVVGTSYNLRDIARRFAPTPTNPDSVEATLRRIVTLNPTLKGKTTLPGGFPLITPAN